MHKLFITTITLIALTLGLTTQGHALQYVFSLESVVADASTTASMDDNKDWYQWLYKVSIEEGPHRPQGFGFSHATIEFLKDCYDKEYLEALAATAGANGVPPNASNLSSLQANEFRAYESVEVGTDPTTNVYGMKWNLETDNFEDLGDVDYFWFSVPTNVQVAGSSSIKTGAANYYFDVNIPDCPDCELTSTPEPATLVLFGSGLMGFLARRKKA